MNQKRRNEIKKATEMFHSKLDGILSEYKENLEGILEDEQDSFDNLPESIQYSEKGDSMEECIDSIQTVIDNLELDAVWENIEADGMFETCGIEW